MYDMMIKQMAADLVKANVIAEYQRQRAEDVLGRMWQDRIALVWTVADIVDRAGQTGVQITEDDARCILHDIHSGHSAEAGVNWQVVDTAIEFYAEPWPA